MVEEAKVHVENWTALENTYKIHLMVNEDKIPVEIRSPHSPSPNNFEDHKPFQ